jgi:hypothetical protein
VSGTRWLVAAAAAMLAGFAATLGVVAAGDRYLARWQRACNYPRLPAPRLPGYLLPLGGTATVLLLAAAVLAVVARRRGSGPTAYAVAVVAVAGAAVAGWFGVHAVLTDADQPGHCAG